ncbi:hypothetical protein M422DRAFT_40059, partial [Sphaerobolus stellatus SS14]
MDPRNLKGIFRSAGMSDYFCGNDSRTSRKILRISKTVCMGYSVRFGSDKANEGLHFRTEEWNL